MYIYLANQIDTTLYKIGISKHPSHRYLELQTGNPNEIREVVTFKTNHKRLERVLHERYRLKNTIGEWFDLTNEEVSLFIDTCTKLEESLDVLKKYDNPFI